MKKRLWCYLLVAALTAATIFSAVPANATIADETEQYETEQIEAAEEMMFGNEEAAEELSFVDEPVVTDETVSGEDAEFISETADFYFTDEVYEPVANEQEEVPELTDVVEETQEEIPETTDVVEDIQEEVPEITDALEDTQEEVTEATDVVEDTSEEAVPDEELEIVEETEEQTEEETEDTDAEIFEDDIITSLVVSDVIHYEGDGYQYTEFLPDDDDMNGDSAGGSSRTWYRYDDSPNSVSITTETGKTYEGSFWDIYEELSDLYDNLYYQVEPLSPQSYDNQWGVGEHPVTLTFGNKTAEYKVIIKENPIVSIEADDISILEGNKTDFEYYRDGEESIRWDKYYVNPSVIRVTTKDDVFEGSPWEVTSRLNSFYGTNYTYYCESGETYDKQWQAGNHTATLTIGNKTGLLNVKIVENPIKSIDVDDIVLYEGNASSSYDWDEDSSTSIEYPYYDPYPQSIKVTTTDDVFEGNMYTVCNELSEAYGVEFNYSVSSNPVQSIDNQWGVGTYKAVLTIGNKTKEYNVIIKQNPIKSVTIEKIIVPEDNGRESTYYQNGVENTWTYYSYTLESITITTVDKEFSGSVYSVINKLENYYNTDFTYGYTDDQTYDKPWTIGTHKATFTISGKEYTFDVEIIGSLIKSVEVSNKTVIEGNTRTASSYIDDGTGDSDDGDSYGGSTLVSWQKYDETPSNIKVTTTDGKVYEGSFSDVIYELYDSLGIDIATTVSSDQSYEKQWGLGEHDATLKFGKHTVNYKVIIIKDPITSIEVEDVNILEGDKGDYDYYYDENGNEIEWELYYVTPGNVTITTSDGQKFEGNIWSAINQLNNAFGGNYTYYCETDQKYTNQWKAGKHTATLHIGNNTKEFNVNIIENPVKTIEVEDVSVYEGNAISSATWDPIAGESIEYYRYNVIPQSVKVTTTSGKVFEGSLYEVCNELGAEYGIYFNYSVYSDPEQGPDNQWQLGSHTAFLRIGSTTAEYNVTVKANPIKSVKVGTVQFFEGSGRESYYYDGMSDESVTWTYYEFYWKNIPLTVTTSDGQEFSGDALTVVNNLDRYYKTSFNYSINSDQSYEKQWKLGKHKATFTIGGVQTEFEVEIISNAIVSVDVQDLTILEDNAGRNYGIGKGVPSSVTNYRYYQITPNYITVKTANGKTYSGYPADVYNTISNDYNVAFNYWVDTSDSSYYLWKKGDHKATYIFGGVKAEYTVHILENPITSVKADNRTMSVNDYTDTSYVNEYGETVAQKLYLLYPNTITVVAGGKTYSGNLYDVISNLEKAYGCTINTGVENNSLQLSTVKPGEYKLTFTLCGKTAEYTVTVAEAGVPQAPATVDTANLAKGISVTWSKAADATGYLVYRKAGSGKYSLVATLNGGANTSYTDTAATSNGTRYIYLIYSFATNNGETVYSSECNYSMIYRLSRPTLSSVTNSASKKMTVKWNKNAKASGYLIVYSQSSSFADYKYAVAKKASTVSKVISKLTKGKTYYVVIYAYKTVGGVTYYSTYSKVKKVKISK